MPEKSAASPPRSSWWPLALLGTLLFAFITSKRDQFGESIHPQDRPEKTHDIGHHDSAVIPQVVPTPPGNTKTKTTCRPDQTPWWKTLGEGIALFGGIGLLIVNIYQLRASQSAADTAKDAVHISERAYITVGAPQPDFTKKTITVFINNSGRIPSGPTTIITHRLTLKLSEPDAPSINLPESATDSRWKKSYFDSVPTGTPFSILMPFTQMDEKQLLAEKQQILVVGSVSYNDGFSGTPQQTWNFCVITVVHRTLHQVYLTNCDPVTYLPAAELADHYPGSENQDR